ncbi:reticulon-1 isoform X2 [Cephus cinctus]|uniref:Reticulon-like protein n=1 Tax=Cephus cinctus TaxID=211228 RepID=A0AAJ7C373_CEPCN|nr:reticulon-1 isoform X2 [Cephus cinctus]
MENTNPTKEHLRDLAGDSARPSLVTDTDAIAKLKRDHDSMDDFEHLDHDSSPIKEVKDITKGHPSAPDSFSSQLIDLPRATGPVVEKLIDVNKKLEQNLLDTSIPTHEKELQPVPATPPPSADFENDVLQRIATTHTPSFAEQVPQVDSKITTMNFMDGERFMREYDAYQSRNEQPQNANIHDNPNLNKFNDEASLGNLPPKDSGYNPLDVDSGIEKKPEVKVENKIESENKVSEDKVNLFEDSSPEQFKNAPIIEPEPSPLSSAAKPTEKLLNLDEMLKEDILGEIKSSVLPVPQMSPELDFLKDEPAAAETKHSGKNLMEDDSWNVVEKPEKHEKLERDENIYHEPPSKPLPPLPKDAELESFDTFSNAKGPTPDKFELSNDFIITESTNKAQPQSGTETGDSEFESEPEPSPAKSLAYPAQQDVCKRPEEPPKHEIMYKNPLRNKDPVEDIAPKEIFREMGLVAALIYWRDPKKSGIVFGAILGVLLSLAYFSLISVLAYLSLLTLTGTVAFRIYKNVLQAVQKTSDGHPFKDILDVDLTLPAEKVHEFADVAVAHANAAVTELRRLFLVEDIVDSLKFGILLWCLTYLGSWFNGMTLIIIGVVALFTLPKVYETNKTQIDQNLALVRGKVNEITAKVKAAIPLGKKAEPTKED